MRQENNLASSEAKPSLSPISSEADSNRKGILRGVLIASSLVLFAGAAALGMVQPSGESLIPPEQKLVQQIVSIPLTAESSVSEFTQPQAATPFVHETRIRAGDSLATVLKRLDIADSELLSFMARDPNARAVYKLYPGRSVQSATNEQGQLLWIRYFHSPNVEANGKSIARLLQISTTENGFKAQEIEQLTEIHTEVALGTIERSLFATTDAAGIPDGITSQMAEVLGSKIDFLRGLKRGDQFRVVYETLTNEGRTVGNGRVLALEFVNNGRPYSAIWYSPDGKSGSYYDANGDSLQGAFLRNAIKFSRISSTFGLRTMAGHQAWSGHHPGIDYAAPSGTPIHATADGTIEHIGWKNGYGNTVVIKHHGKISTLYAHQSRFADGLSVGSRVSQGQLIGYVGSTGWSTGAHLHYEFRVADKPIDPLTAVVMPQSMPLSTEQREEFAQAVAPYKQQLQVLAKFQEAVSESNSVASR
jgi:murein DD-endopeptidase MepM/ murein hydrolase activator NlpD